MGEASIKLTKYRSFLIVFFVCFNLNAQSTSSRFSKLSSPEKWWVFWHPFKAKKALDVSLKTLTVTDSISLDGVIGSDNNGGQLDAFKHAYWMAGLTKEIGNRAALKLGRAHEKGNYKTFKNGKKEEGIMPDKASSEMDLFNNTVGASISMRYLNHSMPQLVQEVLSALERGELKIIKKDKGNFLTCEGLIISPKDLKGHWENNKCLIPSDQ